MLDDYLAPASMLLGILLALVFFRVPFEIAQQIGGELAINEAEANLINPPLARILDKRHFDGEIKRRIQSSGDYIGLGMGLLAYVMRTAVVLQYIGGQVNGLRSSGAALSTPAPGSPASGGIAAGGNNGHQAAADYGFINAGGLLG